MRRLAVPLVTAALVAAALCVPAAASASRPDYLKLAKQGLSNAHKYWWNKDLHWYNDNLDPNLPYETAPNGVHIPLATVWSLVPVLEAVDGVAIAEREQPKFFSKKQRKKVKKAAADHAKFMERYFNPDLAPHGGYAPYPGDRGSDNKVWFDDNSWWGLAFIDAFRATGNGRFLTDAMKASDFIDARGWQGGDANHGMWWNTYFNTCAQTNQSRFLCSHSLEALGAATALAAEIYQYSGKGKYHDRANEYINWADKNARDDVGLYENSKQPVMTYVEGPMIGANLALCRKGDQKACSRGAVIARASLDHWGGPQGLPNFAPQFDTIFFRYILQWGTHDKNPVWRQWTSIVAQDAKAHSADSRKHGLFLKMWDGSSVENNPYDMHYGQIQTHGALVDMFAWLAIPNP